ncbi:putative transcription factor IIIc-like protein [Penicillium brasilianum]|uniref:Putative transcription factor IIIc-like protein n=1 Tax=Penicillium brasilianum TaxID=104259 RepID=A0A1S9RC10_PENBI|nr:putative transcription factor IIIc-like protein [Penicillium brasilianum]
MPRKTNKKQTRLAFAPTVPSHDANETESDRFARLSYGHPSFPTVRPEMSRQTKHKSPPVEASSLTATTSHRKAAAVKESKHEKRENHKKEKDKKDKKAKKEKKKSKLNEQQAEVQPAQQKMEDSSDDEIVVLGPMKQARRAANVEFSIMKPFKSPQSPQAPSDPPSNVINIDSSEEDEGDIVQPRRRLKRKAERSSVILSDSDDSEPVVSSPVKRRRRVSPTETPQTPHSSVDKDQQELEDDVKDLQDSVVKNTRTRGGVYESARDKKLRLLETLRRRRAGQKEKSEDEDEEEDEESEAELPRSSPTQHFFNRRRIDNDDSEVESAIDANEDLDRYEDDFVLEDNELGVPTEEIPFEFTRHAYKQPKEYFRDVVSWMVHNRIDPAFPRDDAMYQMAFQKLGDEVKARAGSSLISSVWTPKFRQVLLARPYLEITGFPTSFMHSCDACNRAGHPASSDLKFYGKAYSEETLEPLTDETSDDDSSDASDSSDSSNDDSSDVSDVERDRDGNILPDENTRFYLGKTCKANAYMAHILTHWRFQLNEWVVDYLRRMGHMEDAEVLRRENLSQKRKTRNAIDAYKKMEADGEIEKLYRDFHIHLKTAREKTSTMELLQNIA